MVGPISDQEPDDEPAPEGSSSQEATGEASAAASAPSEDTDHQHLGGAQRSAARRTVLSRSSDRGCRKRPISTPMTAARYSGPVIGGHTTIRARAASG